ncbi:MAG: ERF family protein [Clostridia bacterium]|nr:ERF family protein [Clostridia bacterium]
MSELNIFQRMAAISVEMATVGKNLTVGDGKNKYKAVSERDIIDAVKPLEAKYGVYSYPVSRRVLESNLLESEITYNGNTTKKTTFMTRIETTYRFVNMDKPDEYIEIISFAEGIDPQDKGSGKAMTYADKYALMKAYKISTGDDPDQEASQPTEYKKAAKPMVYDPNNDKAYRNMLLMELDAKGINVTDYCREKGLNKDTPTERVFELLKELMGCA